jgi:hypothetical protein
MAKYKDDKYLTRAYGSEFDQIHEPGATAPYSGIYRCEGCGHEETSIASNRLPPQNHHQHTTYQGRIRWRLVVRDEAKA